MKEPLSVGGGAFDALAADYDREEAANPIRQLMRQRSLAILESAFPPGASLLDIGCGTGTEAIWLAQRGRTVLGVDSSPQMLEVLSQRAAAVRLEIATRMLRAGDLLALAEEFGEGSFDGAYSSFGALNTEPGLEAPLAALSILVRPEGRIVLSVMNRWCIAEMAFLVFGGRAGQALRRARSSLVVAVGSSSIEVRYPSWRHLSHALHPNFRVLTLQALPFLLLPYAWPTFAAHPRLYGFTKGLDGAMAPHRPFAWLGDHLLVVAERRSPKGASRFDLKRGYARRPMSVDQEGYGFPEHQRTIARLMDDVRILSPSGVERVAQGWDEHVGEHGLPEFREAEKAALHAIEKAERGAAWDEVRRTLFGMTESGSALVSWRAEHGEMGHKAENAAFAAALGLLADGMIGKEHQHTLLRPMAEALPWLLQE